MGLTRLRARPVDTRVAPKVAAPSAFSIQDDALPGAAVWGAVVTNSPDPAPVCAIVSGNAAGRYSINPTTGAGVVDDADALEAAEETIVVSVTSSYGGVQLVTVTGEVTAAPAPANSIDVTAAVQHIFDTAEAETVATVAVELEEGEFAGTLAFKQVVIDDLEVSSTDKTLVRSATHPFGAIVSGTDLVAATINGADWIVTSASHPFIAADLTGPAGYNLGLEILGGSGWYADTMFPLLNVAGGAAYLQHTGTSTRNMPSQGTTGGHWRIVRRHEIGCRLAVAGGGDLIAGTYTVVGYTVDGWVRLDKAIADEGGVTGEATLTYDGGGGYSIDGTDIVADGVRAGAGLDQIVVVATEGELVLEAAPLFVTRIGTAARQSYHISEDQYGTTGVEFHVGTGQRWTNLYGDWIDGDGTPQGSTSYHSAATITWEGGSGSTSPDNDLQQDWALTITALVTEVAGEAATVPLELLLVATQSRKFATRHHPDHPAPWIEVTYSDASTGRLGCLADLQLSSSAVVSGRTTTVDSNTSVNLRSAFRFERPDPAKTVSAAVLHVRCLPNQFGGTATPRVLRIATPLPAAADLETGIAAGAAFDAGLAEHADVVLFHGQQGAVSDELMTGIDTSSAANFDDSGVDAGKYPQLHAGKFINDGELTPTIVDGAHTADGYLPLHASSPDALRWAAPHGTESITADSMFFRSTADGDQAGETVDGSIPAVRKSSDIAPKFSTVNGSNVVTVTDENHGASLHEFIRLKTPIIVGGIILGALHYRIESVPDPHTYTILAAANATADVTEGGTTPTFTVASAGHTYATVDMGTAAGFPASGTRLVLSTPITVAGLTFAAQTYNPTNVATDSMRVAASSGTASGSGSAQLNGGDALIDYLGGTLGNGCGDGVFPEEMHLRGYWRLGDRFLSLGMPTRKAGGKFLSGFVHFDAGFGGRFTHHPNLSQGPVDLSGRNGWTCRNQFKMVEDFENCFFGAICLGTYQYNAEESQVDHQFGLPGAIYPATWFCFELRMKINTHYPDGSAAEEADGELEAWIDGRRVYLKTDFLWRRNPPYAEGATKTKGDQAIRGIWDNCFFGGVDGGCPWDVTMFRKNFAVASSYIGPMATE